MNAEQFACYIEELNTHRLREEERRDAKLYRFRVLEMHTKATPSCDGSSVKLVRAWFKAIEITRPYFELATRDTDTHYLIVASLTGSMRSCYEHFQAAQEARDNVTWEAVRAHLREAYLTTDEQEHLRSELERIKQGAFESCAIYGRRFREAAHQAYAPTDRNAVVHKLLLDVYLRGLRDKPLVHKLIMESNPATLDEAFDIVAEFIARKERMTRVLKQESEPSNTEEPMEVGAVTAGSYKEQPRLQEVAATSATATSKMEDAMCNMARQVAGLQKEMSRMKAASIAQNNNSAAPTHQPPPLAPINQTTRGNTGRQQKYPSHTPEGTIVCYECGSPGHIGRDCDRRRVRFAKQNQNSGNY
jgi:hypothetical protein